MKGKIFNIQKFCLNDGPGIRTSVFLKGCPLRCVWCHNPESQAYESEIIYYKEKCTMCGKCALACKPHCHQFSDDMHIYNRENCIKCFDCISSSCDALNKVGEMISSEEIIDEVMKDKIFYDNSGGGITLTGGEPLFQFEFSYDILKLAKKNNLHTAIETCGFADSEKIKRISQVVDLFLFDYKETDAKLHKRFTQIDNAQIINNLETINNLQKEIILRCPIIPSYNNRKEHFDGICSVANRLKNIKRIEIEPYHPLGVGKYIGMNRAVENIPAPDEARVDSWVKTIQSGTNVKVISI